VELVYHAAHHSQEQKNAQYRNHEAEDLHPVAVFTVSLLSIFPETEDKGEKEKGRAQVLNAKAPVEDEVRLPPLDAIYVLAAQAGQRVSNPTYAAEEDLRIPLM
jgi:hypothetical protein